MHRRLRLACATGVLLALPAMAQAANIGVSMALFDDNFLTVLRNGMQDYAAKQDGVTLQVEDAQNDVSKQLQDEISHFFEIYKNLENKHVEVEGWFPVMDAWRVIEEAHQRYKDEEERR